MVVAALVGSILVSLVIPLIIWIILIAKNKEERKGIIVLFVLGALFYIAMQFGIKQQGLAYLFNNTNLQTFMDEHYISYLILVALIGAVLAIIPELITILVIYKKKITFKQAVSLGLGYTTAESMFLIGYLGIAALVKYIGDNDYELVTSAETLFLSDFERILLGVTGIGLIVCLIYFIEENMTLWGILIKVICQALVAFLPGFLIAFSTKDLLEVFDRSMALIIIYIILTAVALCAAAFMNSVKWKMWDIHN